MKLKYKFFVAYLLFTLIALLTIFGYYFFYAKESEVQDYANDEQVNLEYMSEIMGDKFNYYKIGVEVLENYESVRGFIRAYDSSDRVDHESGYTLEEWKKLVISAFSSTIKSNSSYFQVRFLDLQGNELIRVDRKGDKAYVVGESELQDKSGRYYFQELIDIESSQIYFSKIDLNVEDGIIEQPFRSTLRVGKKIVNESGNPVGLIIVNVDANDLFGVMGGRSGAERRLTSEDGEYLYYPSSPETEYGLQLNNNYIDDDYFDFRDKILSQGQGNISVNNESEGGGEKRKLVYKVMEFGDGEFKRRVVLFSDLYTANVTYNLDRNFLIAGGLVILVSSLAFGLGYLFLLRVMLRDINVATDALSMVKQGKFDLKPKAKIGREMSVLMSELSSVISTCKVKFKSVDSNNKEVEEMRRKLEEQQIALLNVLEDVTEEKDIEHNRSQSLLETIGEGIVVVDDDGIITYINPAFQRMFGYSNEDLRGKDFAESLKAYDLNDKPVDVATLSNSMALTTAKEEIKLLIEGANGKKLAVVINAAPIRVKGEFKGVVRIFHDFSDDLNLQRQKDDFFSIASHELRTPLTVISGNLDMLLTMGYADKIDKDGKELIEDSVEASDRLIRMVSDFLNVSRIEQGRLKMDISNVDVCGVAGEVVEELKPLAEEKGIDFSYECSSKAKGSVVAGDKEKIREAIINFVGNSLKFTKKGYIKISVMADDEYITVVVEDTGIGIDAKLQNSLFRRFQQAMDRTLAREAGGTGLGLYITREFVRKMGGDAWLVKSEKGKGSTFAFRIPLVDLKNMS